MAIRSFLCIFAPISKDFKIMTALAQRIKETPLAPYMGLLDGMTREQKMIVVTYITESMEEPVKVGKPYKMVPVSSEVKKWNGCASFTEEEIESDARLKAILS